jgi:hypothetical protein
MIMPCVFSSYASMGAKLRALGQNNINHQQVIEYEQAHYPELSHTRSDAGPKPYGSGNYCTHRYLNQGSC